MLRIHKIIRNLRKQASFADVFESVDQKSNSLVLKIPIHCCTHNSCQICTRLPKVPPNQPHVKDLNNAVETEGTEEKKGEKEEPEIENLDLDDNQSDLDVESVDFTKEELYRIQTIYRKYHYLKHGKLRKKELFNMMKECLIPFDKKKIPENFWNLSSELYLQNINEFMDYIRLFRKDKEINYHEIEIDKILRYPLPTWLKMEFKISEILLYQHQFSLIDIDGGGSIDSQELQGLFTSIGSQVSLEEVRI